MFKVKASKVKVIWRIYLFKLWSTYKIQGKNYGKIIPNSTAVTGHKTSLKMQQHKHSEKTSNELKFKSVLKIIY